MLISLVYEKTTYKFIIFMSDSTGIAQRGQQTTTSQQTSSNDNDSMQNGILLAKSSPLTLKALQRYLDDTFGIGPIKPLKLPSKFILKELESYLTPIAFDTIVGTLNITISFSAPIAPHLQSLTINIPSQTLWKAYEVASKTSSRETEGVMGVLGNWLFKKTGLNLPLRTDQTNNTYSLTEANHNPNSNTTAPSEQAETQDTATEPQIPLRISRILNAAYAISTEGRLKLASKAVQAADSRRNGLNNDDEASPQQREGVVVANETLLHAILDEAQRQARGDTD
jgi:hypothetical protein